MPAHTHITAAPHPRVMVGGGAALIVAAIVVIYARSTTAYFFNDDFHWLEQTPSFAVAHFFDPSRYDHFYRPVIETYFFIGWSLFGCDPSPFHIASVAIHGLTSGAVFLLARASGGTVPFALLAALFFAVQPGLTDAVTWVGAITDQLPVLWYALTLWAHLRNVQRVSAGLSLHWAWSAATLVAFVLCLLTHESSATLLSMMLVADLAFAQGTWRECLRSVARRWVHYLPYAVLLVAYLAIAYVVNSRSYLVSGGHYALGWHAVPNIANYVIWLYVGRRAVIDYIGVVVVCSALAVWGTARMRFALAWIVITLLPVAFFTWDNAARYLYLPAVGFALLLADLMFALQRQLALRLPSRVAQATAIAVSVFLLARFGVFAKEAADSFPDRTASYSRFVTELRRVNPTAGPGSVVTIDQRFLEGVPELYRQPAARVGLCTPGIRLEMR